MRIAYLNIDTRVVEHLTMGTECEPAICVCTINSLD